MASTAYYLTENDVAELREMTAWFRRVRDLFPVTPSPTPNLAQSPEVYLAKVPPGGIPALSQGGTTGTGTDQPLDDTPGSSECEIYQLMTMDSDTAPTFGRVGELTYRVYNLSPTAINASDTPWVTVHKDKFGEWFVGGTGGGSSDLDFEDFTDTFEAVTSVTNRECGFTARRTPYVITARLPRGSSIEISVAAGGTGTGSADDGDDFLINYPTRLVTLPVFPISATFNETTCEVEITPTYEQFCIFTGGRECCPDYTGTGTD